MHRHDIDAVLFRLADFFDLKRYFIDAVTHPPPIAIETDQDRTHPGRYLILVLLQDRLEKVLQSAQAFAHRDALFDQEGANLTNRRRLARRQVNRGFRI